MNLLLASEQNLIASTSFILPKVLSVRRIFALGGWPERPQGSPLRSQMKPWSMFWRSGDPCGRQGVAIWGAGRQVEVSFAWIIADVLAALFQLQLTLEHMLEIVALPKETRTFLMCVLNMFQPRNGCQRFVCPYNSSQCRCIVDLII